MANPSALSAPSLPDTEEYLWKTLDESILQLSPENLERLLIDVVRYGMKLAGRSVGALYRNSDALGGVRLEASAPSTAEFATSVSYEDVGVGRAVGTGTVQTLAEYRQSAGQTVITYRDVVAIPISSGVSVSHALLLANVDSPALDPQLSERTLNVLQKFAQRAGIVLRMFDALQLASGRQLAHNVQSEFAQHINQIQDVAGIGRALVTAVTASHGLRFNSAVLLLVSEQTLAAVAGVGHFRRENWEEDIRQNRDYFPDLKTYLERNTEIIPKTPLGDAVSNLVVDLDPDRSGIFYRVLDNQKAAILSNTHFNQLPDAFHSAYFGTSENLAEVALIPLNARGLGIGILVVDNRFNRNPITHDSLGQLVAVVNAGASAIASLRGSIGLKLQFEKRLEQLKLQFDAMRDMAKDSTPARVQRQIVKHAKKIFGARYVLLLSLDPRTDKDQQLDAFLPDQISTFGFSSVDESQLRNNPPQIGRITHSVLENNLYKVENTAASSKHFEPEQLHPLLRTLGIRSFVGVVLQSGTDTVGVLYLNYTEVRSFGEVEEEQIKSFAAAAAISLFKARLYDEVSKVHAAAGALSDVIAKREPTEALGFIAERTKEILSCGSVRIWQYDTVSHEFLNSPNTGLPRELWHVIAQEADPSASIAPHMILDGNGFILGDPNAKSSLAIQLRSAGSQVGVMVVNYHARHRFMSAELENIDLFAEYAAVAIRNAHLLAEQGFQLVQQEKLRILSEKFLGNLTVQQTLDTAVTEALSMFHAEFCHIVLPDETRDGYYVASVAGEWPKSLVEERYHIPKESHAGYAARQGRPIAIEDIDNTDVSILPLSREYNINSALATPIIEPGGVLEGVMLVASHRRRKYSKSDHELLQVTANHTATAMTRARAFEQLSKRTAQLNALYAACRDITTETLGANVLEKIVKHAVHCITQDRERPVIGCYLKYINAIDSLSFETIYCSDPSVVLSVQLGTVRSLEPLPGGRVSGITARAAIEKKTVLVESVNDNEDYIEIYENTKAELDVPLLDQNRELLGVLSLESPYLADFGPDNQKTIKSLAELATIVITNARVAADRAAMIAHSAHVLGDSFWRHWAQQRLSEATGILGIMELDLKVASDESLKANLNRSLLNLSTVISAIQTGRPADDQPNSASVGMVLSRLDRVYSKHHPKPIFLSPEPDIVVAAPPFVFLQIIEILLENAIRAIRESHCGTFIEVAARRKDSRAYIYVTDDGPGIPVDERSRILEDKIRSSHGQGVGLLMARGAARNCGGDLAFDPTPKRTRFVLMLPIQPTADSR